MKNLIIATLVLFVLSIQSLVAQIRPDHKLPVDSAVTIGKLDNGLTYYISENRKPENRAYLRLVINAGSILEDDDQQGLAHFIEHMAFNGTKNFAKQEIINYLESIGMRFGPEINAYTGFDETVYMLEIPMDSLDYIKTGLKILSDWSTNILFEVEEIEKERGVIIEEWRGGRGASARIADKQYPVIFKNSKYAERLPIGKMEIIEKADRETIVRYYKDWYRPDLMAVVAVGDFDGKVIEELIKNIFADIPQLSSARKRIEFEIPDFEGTRFAIASDKELTLTAFQLYLLNEKETTETISDYRKNLIKQMYNRMFNERLAELKRTADPPFVNAFSGNSSIARTKSAYSLSAMVNENGIERAMTTMLREAERVRKFGFTATELERQKLNMGRMMEKFFAEQENRKSNTYAGAYSGNFLTGSPILSVEDQYNLYVQLAEGITLEEINDLAKELITTNNRVVLVSSPEKEEVHIPTEDELRKLIDNEDYQNVTAFVDQTSSGDLIEVELKPAEIITEEFIPDVNITKLELANGVQVYLKSTDFKNDEILFSAVSPGGNSLIPDDKFVSSLASPAVINESGLGKFSLTELRKRLAGKVLSVFPWISELDEGFDGTGTPDDIETLFQLIYLYFTSTREDTTAYRSFMSRMDAFLQNRTVSPDAAFQDTVSVTMSNYHFRSRPWTREMISEINYEDTYEIFKDRFANADDFTFIFVGAFDVDSLKPVIQKYLGNLPSTGRKETWKDSNVNYPVGVIKKELRIGIEPKSKVMLKFTGDYEWSRESIYNMNSLAEYLDIKLREVIREDMSGTYGVSVWVDASHYPKENYSFSITFGCNPDRVEELTGEVFAQIDSLVNHAPVVSYVDKIKEMQLRERETDMKENNFWLYAINNALFHDYDVASILNYKERIENLSSEVLQETAGKYLNKNNYVEIILYPEEKK